MSTRAPSSASSARSSAAPGASGPRRLVSTKVSAPRLASQRRPHRRGRPYPPVTRTVPRTVSSDAALSRAAAYRTSRRPHIPDGRIAIWSFTTGSGPAHSPAAPPRPGRPRRAGRPGRPTTAGTPARRPDRVPDHGLCRAPDRVVPAGRHRAAVSVQGRVDASVAQGADHADRQCQPDRHPGQLGLSAETNHESTPASSPSPVRPRLRSAAQRAPPGQHMSRRRPAGAQTHRATPAPLPRPGRSVGTHMWPGAMCRVRTRSRPQRATRPDIATSPRRGGPVARGRHEDSAGAAHRGRPS